MNDDVLGHLREARAILNEETKSGNGSREVALVITKIEEALLWRQEVIRLRQPTNDQIGEEQQRKQ